MVICSQCGNPLKQDANFCPKCGSEIKPAIQDVVSNSANTSNAKCHNCGMSHEPNLKFCTNCGNSLNDDSLVQTVKTPVKRRRGRRVLTCFLILGTLLIMAGGTAYYFLYLKKPSVTKTLIASYLVNPNDSTEILISHGDELTLKIPPGGIKQVDSLYVYSVENMEYPDFVAKVVKVYDFSFRDTRKFDELVEVSVSYSQLETDESVNSNQDIYALHYNETSGEWEDLLTFIDTDKKKISFFTNHFSPIGTFSSERFKGGLMMKIRSMKRPSTLNSIPDIATSDKILEKFSNFSVPAENAYRSGMDMVSESFGLASEFTGFTEEVAGLPIFNKFNSYAGELGVMFALYQFSTELYDGKDEEAKLNLSKNLLTYSLGKWGWQGLRIANIGIFMIDYSLTKFGSSIHQKADEYWELQYNNFNASENQYRKDVGKWKEFIVKCYDDKANFKDAIDAEIQRYLREFSNDPAVGLMPEIYEAPLMAKEKKRVYDILYLAIDEAHMEITKIRQKEIVDQFILLKDQLNSTPQIRIAVYGEEAGSKAVRGLPVRIRVDKDQHLWQGYTDNSGQLTINFTWLSYLFYGKPVVAELDIKGKTLTQNFTMYASGTDVRFYTDLKDEKEEKEEADLFDFKVPKGTYSAICNKIVSDQKGVITVRDESINWANKLEDYVIKIEVDLLGNVSFIETQFAIRNVFTDTDHFHFASGEGRFALDENNKLTANLDLVTSDDLPKKHLTEEMIEHFNKISEEFVHTVNLEYQSGVIRAVHITSWRVEGQGHESKSMLFYEAVKIQDSN